MSTPANLGKKATFAKASSSLMSPNFSNKLDSPIPFVLICFLIGAWSATEMEKRTGIKDNQKIVIDEIIGVWITVILLEKKIVWLLLGLVLFRFFDIIKLFPIKSCERLPNGWGVMMDDVVAGVYGALSLRFIYSIVNRVL